MIDLLFPNLIHVATYRRATLQCQRTFRELLNITIDVSGKFWNAKIEKYLKFEYNTFNISIYFDVCLFFFQQPIHPNSDILRFIRHLQFVFRPATKSFPPRNSLKRILVQKNINIFEEMLGYIPFPIWEYLWRGKS